MSEAYYIVQELRSEIIRLRAELAAKVKQLHELRDAAEFSVTHVTELRDAWMRGAIKECDGKGGTRSNRNVEVETKLRKALGDE